MSDAELAIRYSVKMRDFRASLPPNPPPETELVVRREGATLVITWPARGWKRGTAAGCAVFGIMCVLLSVAGLAVRLWHGPHGESDQRALLIVLAVTVACFVGAYWFGHISITFQVAAGDLQVLRTAPLFWSRRVYKHGRIRDVRIEMITGSKGHIKNVVRIEDVNGGGHDYLADYPLEDSQWIADALRTSGICR